MMKKIIAAIITTALAAQTLFILPVFAAQRSYILGDANGDGAVSIKDATLIQFILAELIEDTDGAAEMRTNFDGKSININRSTSIQKYIAQLPVDYNIGETVYYDEPTTAQSTTAKTTTAQPTTAQSTTAKPTTSQATTVQPLTDEYELPFIPA